MLLGVKIKSIKANPCVDARPHAGVSISLDSHLNLQIKPKIGLVN
jgi:hypothetical protein